jgi:hypothetical protein
MNCGGKNSPHTTIANITPSKNTIIFGRRIFGLSSIGVTLIGQQPPSATLSRFDGE